MKDDFRRRLEAKRAQLIDKAIHGILSENGTYDVEPEVTKIKSYSELLAAARPKRSRGRIWAVAVAAGCMGVAGMLWSLKVSHTDVSLTLDTDSLRAGMAEVWHIDHALRSGKVRLERLSAIDAPNLGLTIDRASGDAWFALEGGTIMLEALDTQKGALIEVFSDEEEVHIFAGRGRLAGKITVTGKVNVTAGARSGETSVSRVHEIEIPEIVEFSARNAKGVPSQVSIHSPEKWSLGRPRISALSFAREEARGAAERVLTSGIRSGKVRFNDTAWPELELREGDLLSLQQVEKARVEVRGERGLIHVAVNGTIGKVTVGDSNSARVLAPSYLEYFYNKKSLGFFWSGVAFLWGLIWSIRRTIFR